VVAGLEPAAELDADVLGSPAGISLRDVERTYRMGEVNVPALRGVSLEIAPGEFVAVMGPSGCGKSTLLSLLGGLDRPTAGEIRVGDRAISREGDGALAEYRLRNVGTIFQSFNLIASLTARDNVELPMTLAGVPRRRRAQRARRLLDMVGLGTRAGFRPSRLSGGEQQRVSIARALANSPSLILADEPTGNLDAESGASVLAQLERLHAAGATVVVVTHDPEVAERADRVIRLRDGQVVSDDAPSRAQAGGAGGAVRGGRIAALEAFRLGARGVGRRKLRTSLSAAGVAIGIAAMVVIVSFAIGVNNSLTGSLRAAGQLQQVTVTSPITSAGPAAHKPMTVGSLARLRSLPHVTDAWGSGEIQGSLSPASGGSLFTSAFSLSPLNEIPAITSKFLVSGRMPVADSATETVVSQTSLARLHLTTRTAPGQVLTFRGAYSGGLGQSGAVPPAGVEPPLRLRIVGVASAVATGASADEPIVLALPYRTFLDYWAQLSAANHWTGDEFGSITLVADSPGTVSTVHDESTHLGYRATTAQDFLRGFSQFLSYLATGLGGLGGLALLVACLGIANTMYTAVLERTREIGILKAIGARRRDIRNLFLAEAGSIGIIGGVVGVLIALGLATIGNTALQRFARSQGLLIDLTVFEVTPLLVGGAIALATTFSALSGLLPAVRASRLDPSAALRHD